MASPPDGVSDRSPLLGFRDDRRDLSDAAGKIEQRLADGAGLDLLPGTQEVRRMLRLGPVRLEVVPLVEEDAGGRALPLGAVPVVVAERAPVFERALRVLVFDSHPH